MKLPLILTMIAGLAAAPLAQSKTAQVLCYSFDGTGTTSGADNTKAPSKIGIRVGGHGNVFIATKPGMSNEDLADALESELKTKGYTTQRKAKNVVCVVTGPNGAPLVKGGGIGSTDTGLKGIDVGVEKIQIVNPPPPVKKARRSGVAFPKPVPNKRVQQPGKIIYYVDVERIVNGQKVITPVQVQVPLGAGQTSNQVEQRTKQAFQQAGFPVTELIQLDLVSTQPLPLPMPCFGIDWDQQLDPVVHMRVDFQISDPDMSMFPMQIFAGEIDILQGAVQFGEGAQQGLGKEPRIHIDGPLLIGTPFDIFVQAPQPNLPGLLLIGGQDAALPIPFILPGGTLFVDPLGSLLVPMPIGPIGQAHLGGLIPPDPKLAGQQLMLQFATLDSANNKLGLSGGLKVVIGK